MSVAATCVLCLAGRAVGNGGPLAIDPPGWMAGRALGELGGGGGVMKYYIIIGKHSLGLCEEALLLPASFGPLIVQELCESRGGRPGAVRPNEPYRFRGRKAILTVLQYWSRLVPNMSTDIRGH